MPFELKKEKLACGLYVVSTPIGNMRDITLRALDILSNADHVYCEDKRVTGKLLSSYAIKTPLRLYHDHNGEKQRPDILAALEDGQSVALVSDAGTPGVSDPGFKLFRYVIDAGHSIFPVPGASAALAALAGAGLATDRFLFAGFLPPKSAARQAKLQTLKEMDATIILYETANRMQAFVKDIKAVMGQRQIVLARELTKKFEEFIRGDTEEILEILADKKFKGEFVVLIEGIDEKQLSDQTWTGEKLDTLLSKAMGNMNMSVKDAAAYAAKESGQPKRKLYARAVILSKNGLV